MPLPSSQCKEAGSNAELRAAIAGVAECLPDSTDVQTIASSVTACTSFYRVWLAFIALVWKAICYLQTEIENITPVVPVIPGVITALAGSGLGAGGTVTLVTGSTTSDGIVQIVCGAGVSASELVRLHNSLGWPTNVRVLALSGNTSNPAIGWEYNHSAGELLFIADLFFGTINEGDTVELNYSIKEIA